MKLMSLIPTLMLHKYQYRLYITYMYDNYTFWLNDPSILLRDGNYMRFIPTKHMTSIQKLNAITLFSIYMIMLSILFERSHRIVYVFAAIIVMIIVINQYYKYDTMGATKEIIRTHPHTKPAKLPTITDDKHEYQLESGYYDSNNNLIMGTEYRPGDTRYNQNITYSTNELEEYRKAKCKRPSRDNPFMNPPVTDFNTENGDVACNADDENIADEIAYNFNADLYRDFEDLFNVKNSQRQFYTIPTPSIPPDSVTFANWLYKMDDTCKVDQQRCLRYEDLRYKR